MHVPDPCGELSTMAAAALREDPAGFAEQARDAVRAVDPWSRDWQLAWWMLEELAYRGFADAPDQRETDPDVATTRQRMRDRFEGELRAQLVPGIREVLELDAAKPVQELLMAVVERFEGPPLAVWLQRHADEEQMLRYLRQRSVYHRKESDPHSFVLARVDGAAKTALAELQYDEYGAGDPRRLHSRMFADALLACGLDPEPGAYVAEADAPTLATSSVMSLFCLQRRLRGAALGHLAAFEATSALPCRKIVGGLERLGFPDDAVRYYDEHVEADAAHEQVALRGIVGPLVAVEPELLEDVLLGAATCMHVEAVASQAMLDRWQATEPDRDDGAGGRAGGRAGGGGHLEGVS